MAVFLLYIVKVSCILALFCAVYLLFLKNETFFKFNRYFLISGVLIALAMPCIELTRYVEIEPVVDTTMFIVNTPDSYTESVSSKPIDWSAILFIVYGIGVLVLFVKFIVQLLSLFRMVRSNTPRKFGDYHYVETSFDIAPFSFFKYIFYNPSLYTEGELSAIIKHEAVHSSQWHSVDVLLTHFMTIVTWVNPFSWLYQSSVKQNLEFLADQAATKESMSLTNYQYTLLKISGNQYCTPLVNTFYNSLIKKRIVMLNKSKSNKINLLKVLLIMPVLAIFLVSFNTKEVFISIPTESGSSAIVQPDSETIEIIIDKNTSEKELEQIKKDLLQKGVDFSYSSVKHNSKNEISAISIRVTADKKGKSKIKSSSSIDNGNEPIDPIHILIDNALSSISIGNAKNFKMDLHEENDKTVWVHSDSDSDHKTIEIIEENGRETIKVNGKKVSRSEYEAMQKKDEIHEKHIKVKKSKNGDSNVFIWNDDEHDSHEDIIAVEEGNGFFFIDTEGGKPLYIIDGKESNKEDVKYLNPSDIQSIDVSKGKKAKEKYGKKGKNGVVEITTKKKE